MHTLWDERYALRTDNMGSSAIRELLKLTSQPDVISFAGGMPAPEVFPIEGSRKLVKWSCLKWAIEPCSTAPLKAISPCGK